MSLSIILRTLCGCERIMEIPYRHYPPTWVLPYRRTTNFHTFAADGDSCGPCGPGFNSRTFEDTGRCGPYNYRLYIEKEKV